MTPIHATLRKVNKAIAATGVAAELVPGEDYFYFVGPAVERAPSTAVIVYRVGELSIPRWLDELTRILETVPPAP